jgi:IS30 family transposase
LKKRPEIPISVSHETIYKFIWVDKKKEEEYTQLATFPTNSSDALHN